MQNETGALDIEELKQMLIQHKAELSERQERVTRHTRHRDNALPPDFADQAVELANEETLVALDREISQELCQIEHALRRIEADKYLDCEKCDRPIAEQRLIALPYATRCIQCANGSSDGSIPSTTNRSAGSCELISTR